MLAHHACHCHNVGLEAKNMLEKYHIGLDCIVKLVPKNIIVIVVLERAINQDWQGKSLQFYATYFPCSLS